MALVIDEDYIIRVETMYKNKIQVKMYLGIYYGNYYLSSYTLFGEVGCVNKPFNVKYDIKPVVIFSQRDKYIKLKDMTQILEKSKQAKENMEHRALNIILKRLINEEFEWNSTLIK